ncbi:Na+/H+ antiporter NhaA [Pacificimonas sp. WHA3]|uniref:Na(+)/H(+) antiporter NhaA n=1 Tax=Pacificimonas pallii TaxID=2827236 RepID=A0ABS6SIP1_9SPHN|nr:Na+/H+ antiporter NhaA [Pacificimonas pallii]MBV7257928.1 Na+/H+ antiporter NhaA [Pacificimonas pallii]
MPTRFTPMMRDFLQKESSGGLLLFAAAALAIILANSGLAAFYTALWEQPAQVRVGALNIDKPLLLWVNDGLMALFFFLIGLEVKREILVGELSSLDKAGLPIVAAIGGMAIPALTFLFINQGSPENMSGWAIPAATDIAFALGILALLGNRVPAALKVLLLAIAIIDDIGAIAIIALFYTDQLSVLSLGLAGAGLAILVILNRRGVTAITPYALIGLIIWVCVLKSGVHATLAGVAVALAIPLTGKAGHSPLKTLEHSLHPWIAFAVLPIFAFANAGVSLSGIGFADLLAPLPLGIAAGLFIGKQIGVFGFAWVAVKTGIAKLPASLSWRQIYGLSCITGVGFTMSLFIGTLAFDSPAQIDAVKLGVLTGSLLSGLVGVLILMMSGRRSAATLDAPKVSA